MELGSSATSLEDALDSIEPFEDAIPGVGSLEGPLQNMESDFQALDSIQLPDLPRLDNIQLPDLSRVEIYALTGNNQGAPNNTTLDAGTYPCLGPMDILKRMIHEPELLDIVFECDPQHKKELLDALIYGPVRQHQAQSTQTQSHQHHILQSTIIPYRSQF